MVEHTKSPILKPGAQLMKLGSFVNCQTDGVGNDYCTATRQNLAGPPDKGREITCTEFVSTKLCTVCQLAVVGETASWTK